MSVLGLGLDAAEHNEDSLSVQEAELAMKRRLGDSEYNILAVQNNLANTYDRLGRHELALHIMRDVYYGYLKLNGEENRDTCTAANNYSSSLVDAKRFEEARSLLRQMIPVAQRVLGDSDRLTLKMRWMYAQTIYRDNGTTLDDLREAMTTLEDAGRTAQRVLGGAHPTAVGIEFALQKARAALRARET